MLRLQESNNLLLREYPVSRKISKKLKTALEKKVDLAQLSESEQIKVLLQFVSGFKERDEESSSRKSLKVMESGEATSEESIELLIALFASIGMVARVVQLWSSTIYSACEVWSNLYQKWIYLDSTRGIYATHKGKPLSIYAIWMLKNSNLLNEVEFLDGDKFQDFLDSKFGALGVLGPQNSVIMIPLDQKEQYIHPSYNIQYVSSPFDLYYMINRVHISLLPKKELLFITLQHNMPWFSHFERLVDQEWVACKFKIVVDQVGDLQFRAVNKMGNRGAVTSFKIDNSL